jgi:hypothetical protein
MGSGRAVRGAVQRHGQSERINVMLNKPVFLLAATLAAAPMACALAAADTPGNAGRRR